MLTLDSSELQLLLICSPLSSSKFANMDIYIHIYYIYTYIHVYDFFNESKEILFKIPFLYCIVFQ